MDESLNVCVPTSKHFSPNWYFPDIQFNPNAYYIHTWLQFGFITEQMNFLLLFYLHTSSTQKMQLKFVRA